MIEGRFPGSRKEEHEPKVHNVWGTEFGAHNQWSTEPMEHRVIRCTGLWSTTFGAQPLEHRTNGAQGYLEHQANGAQGQMGHRASQIFLVLWIYTFSMIEITTYWKAK